MAFYDTDLAWIHDAGYGWYARETAPGILQTFVQHGITTGRVIDLGCGSGIWARALVDTGYSVAGSDISAAMIKIARARVPEASFQVASFVDVDIPDCDAVTGLGEVFNYLFDSLNGKRALRLLFRRVFNALNPGGLFILDVAEPVRQASEHMGFAEGDGWMNLYEVEHDESNQRLTRRCVTFRRVGKHWRRDEETHELQLWRGSDFAVLLREAGYRVRLARRFGTYELPQGMVGLIARKPSTSRER